jgi:LysM repeat protein
MRANVFVGPVLALGLTLCGCASMFEGWQTGASHEELERENLQADVQRLRERVQGMSDAQQDLYRQIETLKASREAERKDLEARVAEMQRDLKAAEAARPQLKQEIIDSLSRQMAELMRTQAAPPPSKAERGVEHVVQSGQTLSAIAKAYKVTPGAIIKANGLKDANSIRVGQKLFIPE